MSRSTKTAQTGAADQTGIRNADDAPAAIDDDRVLILAPTGCDAVLAAQSLQAEGLRPVICATMGALTHKIASGAGVAIVAQEALTPPELESLSRTLARQPSWSDLPLLLLTGTGRASEASDALVRNADQLSNATLLERPLRIGTLVRAVRVALRARRRQYEIREYLRDRERTAAERVALMEQQRTFLRDVMASVTEGRLHLCDTVADLPARIPPCVEPITLTTKTLRILRLQTQQVAHEIGFDAERIDDLLTSISEAAMNAVVHAGGGVAHIGCQTRDTNVSIQVWITDMGKGITMANLPQATLERGYSSAGTFGHGFWMMLKTADRTYLLTGPEGTTVVIEQDRVPPIPAWMK